jgi:hypothetical protein
MILTNSGVKFDNLPGIFPVHGYFLLTWLH